MPLFTSSAQLSQLIVHIGISVTILLENLVYIFLDTIQMQRVCGCLPVPAWMGFSLGLTLRVYVLHRAIFSLRQ